RARRRREVQGIERADVDRESPARVQEPRTDRAADRRDKGADREARGRQGEARSPEGRTPDAVRRRRGAPERTREGDGGAGRRGGQAAQSDAGRTAHSTS